ncbi:MAG: molybdenum cofactor guanylyltransferase MobA [Pseudomonadales bacterium]
MSMPAGVTRPTPATTTLLVLCGGAGRRVGGADKPLLLWEGRPLIEHVLDRLNAETAVTLVSANRNLDRYECYGRVVTDVTQGHPGPLAGISAGLHACTTEWLLACPGDMPMVPTDLMRRLTQAIEKSGEICHAAASRTDHGLEPLPALLHKSLAGALSLRLEQAADQERSVRGWLSSIGAAWADYRGAEAMFASLNHFEDFGHS